MIKWKRIQNVHIGDGGDFVIVDRWDEVGVYRGVLHYSGLGGLGYGKGGESTDDYKARAEKSKSEGKDGGSK